MVHRMHFAPFEERDDAFNPCKCNSSIKQMADLFTKRPAIFMD